jgi:hypothetical protein
MNTFNRMFFATGLVAFCLGMSSTSGCGGGDYCSTVFNKAVECASPEEKALVEGLKDLVMAYRQSTTESEKIRLFESIEELTRQTHLSV